jgi:hypothetical protein
MVLTADRHQKHALDEGTWLVRVCTPTIANTDRNVLFTLPKDARILDAQVRVDTAATGTTVTGTVNLENTGGDIALSGAIDLKTAGGHANNVIPTTAKGAKVIPATASSTVDVVLDVSSTAPANAPVIMVAVLVAGINQDREAA